MYGRRHGGKPTLALWTLVVLADVALMTKAAGPGAVLAVIAGFAAGGAVLAGWLRLHRTGGATTSWATRGGATRTGWAGNTGWAWNQRTATAHGPNRRHLR
jgi:hypothetical protein